jgi:RimJ/RimL family protein N-acetyltransferase
MVHTVSAAAVLESAAASSNHRTIAMTFSLAHLIGFQGGIKYLCRFDYLVCGECCLSVETNLVPVEDAHFAWMLGDAPLQGGLVLAPGGVDTRQTLELLRHMTRRVHAAGSRGSWMIVSGNEVVGLCSYKQAPKDGAVEIGYGIAASRRRRGHASRAVAAMLEYASADPQVRSVIATIAPDNRASSRAVEANGFVQNGTVLDPEDGELLLWRRDLA